MHLIIWQGYARERQRIIVVVCTLVARFNMDYVSQRGLVALNQLLLAVDRLLQPTDLPNVLLLFVEMVWLC